MFFIMNILACAIMLDFYNWDHICFLTGQVCSNNLFSKGNLEENELCIGMRLRGVLKLLTEFLLAW